MGCVLCSIGDCPIANAYFHILKSKVLHNALILKALSRFELTRCTFPVRFWWCRSETTPMEGSSSRV